MYCDELHQLVQKAVTYATGANHTMYTIMNQPHSLRIPLVSSTKTVSPQELLLCETVSQQDVFPIMKLETRKKSRKKRHADQQANSREIVPLVRRV